MNTTRAPLWWDSPSELPPKDLPSGLNWQNTDIKDAYKYLKGGNPLTNSSSRSLWQGAGSVTGISRTAVSEGVISAGKDQLKGYLDNLESDPQVISSGTLATHNRIIMVGSCYSGIFAKLSKPGRVVITSANFDEQSIAGFSIYNSGSNTTYYGGEYFIDALFSYLGRGDTLKDAFTQSSNMVELRDPRKVPPGTHAGVNDTLAQHPLHASQDGGGSRTMFCFYEPLRIVDYAIEYYIKFIPTIS